MIKLIKAFMVATIALFFTAVAFGNIMDYQANWQFVSHVLSMDTTFKDPQIMWHAITNSAVQHFAYAGIIAWEVLTAIFCWWGVVKLIKSRHHPEFFKKAKAFATIGLFMGFLLYMVGFVVVGGEWFAMWQSPIWNGQSKAVFFITLVMFVLIFLHQDEPV